MIFIASLKKESVNLVILFTIAIQITDHNVRIEPIIYVKPMAGIQSQENNIYLFGV